MRVSSLTGSVTLALILAGCSAAPSHQEQPTEDAAPGVSVTAAPGVAFRYAYGFRLPAERIAAAQEVHAAGCERLGVARCQITAMRFTRTPDNDISGEIAFRIAPELARAFGRDASRVVERSEGSVLDAQITGEDAGEAIAAATGNRSAAETDRKALDARIAAARGTARAELERQRATLNDTIRTTNADIAGQRASLASTPMTFRYESGEAVTGYDRRTAFGRAADLFVRSGDVTFSSALALLAGILPPALLAAMLALVFVVARRFVRGRFAPAG